MVNKGAMRWLWLAALLPAVSRAEVFEWVDLSGRHHYSDRRQAHAKILTVDRGVSYFVVQKVFDGDTLLLSNGQKIRLLGVNTPEVAGRNKNAEAGGEQAKAWLKNRLEQQKVRLEGDVEKQDKYQRTLAHVFTEDNEHINLELVKRGLAAVNIYPPNLKYVDALLAAEQKAEQDRLGVWHYSAYAPQSFQTVNAENYKGWKRITGRIMALKKTAKYSYLQFSDRVSVRIENKFLDLFQALPDYLGKTVEARGWIGKSKDRFAIQVRHPGELKLLKR